MAEALELKPCPFCGGAAEIYQVGNDHLKRRGFEVKCTTWGCSTKKTALVIRHTLQDARRFAVEAWNRRSEPEAARPPEALEGLIERLNGHVRYKYMPAAVRDAMEEAAQALRLLGKVEKMRWEPISTAPCDGGTVILGNPEWEGFCTREWSSEASRDDDLSNWDFGPTHWMRPARPTAALDKIRKGVGT